MLECLDLQDTNIHGVDPKAQLKNRVVRKDLSGLRTSSGVHDEFQQTVDEAIREYELLHSTMTSQVVDEGLLEQKFQMLDAVLERNWGALPLKQRAEREQPWFDIVYGDVLELIKKKNRLWSEVRDSGKVGRKWMEYELLQKEVKEKCNEARERFWSNKSVKLQGL
jgi:hypothetical protein